MGTGRRGREEGINRRVECLRECEEFLSNVCRERAARFTCERETRVESWAVTSGRPPPGSVHSLRR